MVGEDKRVGELLGLCNGGPRELDPPPHPCPRSPREGRCPSALLQDSLAQMVKLPLLRQRSKSLYSRGRRLFLLALSLNPDMIMGATIQEVNCTRPWLNMLQKDPRQQCLRHHPTQTLQALPKFGEPVHQQAQLQLMLQTPPLADSCKVEEFNPVLVLSLAVA